jgi:hypothetical protein
MDNENHTKQVPGRKEMPGCNVSQTLNFSAGLAALIIAGIVAYLIYKYLVQG